jgi:hypothetical protein
MLKRATLVFCGLLMASTVVYLLTGRWVFATWTFVLSIVSVLASVGCAVGRAWWVAAVGLLAPALAIAVVRHDLEAVRERVREEGPEFAKAGLEAFEKAKSVCGAQEFNNDHCEIHEYLSAGARQLAREVWVQEGPGGHLNVVFHLRPGSRTTVVYEPGAVATSFCSSIYQDVLLCGR